MLPTREASKQSVEVALLETLQVARRREKPRRVVNVTREPTLLDWR
jgi:hypothetical protein